MQVASVFVCALAFICGTGAQAIPGGFQNVLVVSEEVTKVTAFVEKQVNLNAPLAAKMTSVISAKRQVVSSGFKWNVSVALVNTTCPPAVSSRSGCCRRSQKATCNATVTQRGSEYKLTALSCSGKNKSEGCAGCLQQQVDLSSYSSLAQTALRLYSKEQNIANVSLQRLLSVSTQVVSGMNYYIEAVLKFQKQVKVCNFTVFEQSWLDKLVLAAASCSTCQKP